MKKTGSYIKTCCTRNTGSKIQTGVCIAVVLLLIGVVVILGVHSCGDKKTEDVVMTTEESLTEEETALTSNLLSTQSEGQAELTAELSEEVSEPVTKQEEPEAEPAEEEVSEEETPAEELPAEDAPAEETSAEEDPAAEEGIAEETDAPETAETAEDEEESSYTSVVVDNGDTVNVRQGMLNAQVAAVDDEYADFALANVNKYVNIRSTPSTEGAILGKLYHGSVAQVLDIVDGEDGEWFKISSGSVEGYVKACYFYYGTEALEHIDEYLIRYAVVNAGTLNVRAEASTDSAIIGYITRDDKIAALEILDGWVKIQYTAETTGYVSADYVFIQEEFIYAKSIEEEQAELAAAQERASRSADTSSSYSNITFPTGDYENSSELRQAIVDYALQFVGNKYVAGGQSLETGTDCSGFTCYIYAAFGYSISRTPSGQCSSAGEGISWDEIQPGDIICYTRGTTCDHVGLYIGDGMIVHSANKRKGVVVQKATFETIVGIRNVIGD